MKNTFKVFAFSALAAVMISFAACATTSSIGGTSEDHGLISSLISSSKITKLASEGRQEVAKFMVIIGLFDVGYDEYAAKVMAVEKQGKKITSVTMNYLGVVAIITAYSN